ncbi:MAG: TIM barrel protein [Lachnospiraceae bacterium]|nr:TIM barrel protein [Lachnospiraceae bacterium]MBQ3602104.1 TIM barrel protein [Lachnospiraceae bacterium]
MIYVSSACLKNNYISETVQQLAQNGIRNIELSGGTKYYSGFETDLKDLKEKYGLNYVCHAYFPPHKKDIVVNLASCDDEVYINSIKHYEECLEFLKRLEIDTLSIHAGFMVEIGTDEIGKKLSATKIYNEKKAYDRFVSGYQHIQKLCKENGIEVYLENNVLSRENYQVFGNNNYFMMTDSKTICEMRERLDFELLLDYGHLYVSANTLGIDYEKECMQLEKEAKWFHLSDNDGIKDQHLPLNEESEIVKQIRRLDIRNKRVTLETSGEINGILKSIEMICE